MADFAPTVKRFTTQQFLILAYDAPNSQPMREEHLAGHLHHIERNVNRYIVCGPLHDGEPMKLYGSFFVVMADSKEDARALLDGDPYLNCGMYERIEVHSVTAAAGTALGGTDAQSRGGVIWESAAALAAAQNEPK